MNNDHHFILQKNECLELYSIHRNQYGQNQTNRFKRHFKTLEKGEKRHTIC